MSERCRHFNKPGIIWTVQTRRFWPSIICWVFDHIPVISHAAKHENQDVLHFFCARCGEKGIV